MQALTHAHTHTHTHKCTPKDTYMHRHTHTPDDIKSATTGQMMIGRLCLVDAACLSIIVLNK